MLDKIKALLKEALELLEGLPREDDDRLVWGKKVSAEFRDRVRWIADELWFDPNWLMACMAFESAETFRANIRNAAGSGAVGLIQFMPKTAESLGTTSAELSNLSAEDQLKYVYKYFEPYRGRIGSLDDMYMSILWPRAVGKEASYPLFVRGGVAYRQNAGLDRDKDGTVSKAEACAKVREKFERGEKFYG